MKKNLHIFGMLVCAAAGLQLAAQSSLLITNNTTSTPLAPNAVVSMTTTKEATSLVVFDIKNTSGSTKSYHAKRYDVVLNKVQADQTEAAAYFCFAGTCYGANVDSSQNALQLSAGQSASQLQGLYQMLNADLDEASSVGFSHVKYTFFNAANRSDSVQISIRYNDTPTGLKDQGNNLTSLSVFPVPAKEKVNLTVNTVYGSVSKLVLFNSIGDKVFEKTVSLNTGRTNVEINTEHLSSGIYIVSLGEGTDKISRRIVINK
jgi:hypothetical protein